MVEKERFNKYLPKQITTLMLSLILMIGTCLLYQNNVRASADPIKITRLAGQDRYGTSNAVVSQGWTQSNYAVLVNSQNFPDAITSSPLAKKYNAPILLTDSNSLTDSTRQKLQNLGAKNVFIIGGTSVVGSNVENTLKSMGITVKRICGQDRYETSVSVAKELGNCNGVFVVSGEHYEDALSTAPIADKLQYPIILVSKNNVPSTVENYINSIRNNGGKIEVIGGCDVLNDSVISSLNSTKTYNQSTKYDRNLALINDYSGQLDLSSIYLASDKGFADALSGSALAGKNGNPIILIGDSNHTNVNSFITNNNISTVNVLGGSAVLNDYTITQITGEVSTTEEPSEIVIKDTDKPLIPTGAGDALNNELWLKYSDGIEELLVSSHSAKDVKDIIAFINTPRFSLDKKKIYFMSAAWATSYAIHVVDIETKSEHFVCDGNSLKVIQSGSYAGDLIVNKHKYNDIGAYDDYYIVTPEGEEITDLGDDPEVLNQYE